MCCLCCTPEGACGSVTKQRGSKPSILALSTSSPLLVLSGRAGPELSGLAGIPFPGSSSLVASPAVALALQGPEVGQGWHPWDVGASQTQGQWKREHNAPAPLALAPWTCSALPSPTDAGVCSDTK